MSSCRLALLVLLLTAACSSRVELPEQIDPADPPVAGWDFVAELPIEVALFKTVFWDPRDTVSLRELIRDSDVARGKSVLEIGTGSGLLSLCALQAGAARVVATDVNPNAVANARYNADRMGFADRFEVRPVSLDNSAAFAVIGPKERFDVIVSNPPWVDRKPTTIGEFALYDEGFDLLESLFAGLREHLTPGGRVLLAYGAVEGVRAIQRLGAEHAMEVVLHDERNLDELPEEFLPGMMIEVIP